MPHHLPVRLRPQTARDRNISRRRPTIIPDNPISEIAQREILRRQERIRQMDSTALEANRALSENDLEGAVSGFRQASGVTP
ncbi:MAG: hypothetical protein KGR69_08305 [Verrucomicrobia bacterium]|nr:hypothetical protein [Verrucomicrobiota bacterium]